MSWTSTILLWLYGFAVSWLMIPRISSIVRRYKIFRKPSDRDLHWRLVPKLTGIVFYLSLLLVSFVFVPYSDPQRLMLLLCSGSIIVYIGVRDDIYELSPYMKLLLQIMAISFFVLGDDLVVRNLFGFLGLHELPIAFAYFFTYFIGVFMINAFNLCDGIDGLAGLIAIIMAGCYAIVYYVLGDVLFFSYSMILIGSLVGFLRFNLSNKSKVFMGDTGSLFLGFIFFVFTMYFVTNDKEILSVVLPSKSLVFILAMSIFLIPIIDSGSVFFYRALKKRNPLAPDNKHLHHIVLNHTKSHVMASVMIASFLLIYIGLMSFLSFRLEPSYSVVFFFASLAILFLVLTVVRRINEH